MQKIKSLFLDKSVQLSLAAGSLLASGFAAADTTDQGAAAVSLITSAGTSVAEVGAASLAVYVSIKVFKLIKAAL